MVVTFNKKDLLKECIDALLKQTVPLDKIIIFDNASSDGTKEYLDTLNNNLVQPIFSDKNLGGAGGFNQAIKEGMKLSPEYIWIMDDDSIVEVDALENLLEAKNTLAGDFGFLSSNVLWTDREPCLMNIPKVEKKWNSKAHEGLIQLKTASFVSLFVNAKAIKKVGYPISEFFIWGDDTEYTQRISKNFPSYFVSDSIVIHKMNDNAEVNILIDDKNRIHRYYYDIRNKFYHNRKLGKKELVKYFSNVLSLLFKITFLPVDHKILKIKTVTKGFFAGIVFNPNIEEYEN